VAAERRSERVLRIFIAHGLAYPIAVAWALGSIPLIIAAVASAQYRDGYGDPEIARHVLTYTLWPLCVAFGAAHVPGVVWAWSRDDVHGRRLFFGAMALLGGVPTLVGAALWGWLVLQ
jgi:hypothetical protein